MSQFVLIQSQQNVRVTRGLDVIDNTNYNSDIPNRANYRPNWTKSTVIIKAGQHVYPAEIAEWKSVKALQKDRVLTIGEIVDESTDYVKKEEIENAKKLDEKLQEGKNFEKFNKEQNIANKKKVAKKEKVELKEVNLEELSKEGE